MEETITDGTLAATQVHTLLLSSLGQRLHEWQQ